MISDPTDTDLVEMLRSAYPEDSYTSDDIGYMVRNGYVITARSLRCFVAWANARRDAAVAEKEVALVGKEATRLSEEWLTVPEEVLADIGILNACEVLELRQQERVAQAARITTLESEVDALREALEDAGRFVKAELKAREREFCLFDADGRPDYSTLSDDDGPSIGEASDCLARIEDALTKDTTNAG